MSELDKLCRILLDEQDLVEHDYKLPKKKLDEFNKIWKNINQDRRTVKRLEELLDKIMSVQDRVHYVDHDLSKRIRDLEWIRGRRYIKCTKCKSDITLHGCDHHKKRVDITPRNQLEEVEKYPW